ncbi:outer membrane protein [Hyphomicrobium denitrificans]|nr:outer membrane beta-barrel protein [Hyphomicrobium denitrificans]
MKKFIYALAVLGALSFGAVDARADGSLKDAAAPLAEAGRCVGGAFSGAYLGAQIGGGSLRSSQDVSTGEGGSFSDNGAAFTIGTHSGYNVQCGRVLFGIESDFNYFQADTDSHLDYSCAECSNETGTASFKTSMNWFGTLRGRLGIVQMDNILIYATGGLAYADIEHSFSDTGPGFSRTDSNTEYGWTAGGGVEFLRNGPWSIRADALYIDLGSQDHTYTLPDCEVSCTSRSHWDDNFWVARVGFTYHIGDLRREAPIVPLK